MAFIDAQHLRFRLKEYFGHDRIYIGQFVWQVLVRLADFNIVHGEIVRSYFYDAKFIDGDDRRKVQEEYFDHIRQSDYCEVRLGRLIDAPEGPRQKGVDVLMAIDMLGKAYENHYDIAVVLAGGDDFVDIIQAVRDAGKRVCGAYFDKNASPRLIGSFDRRLVLTKNVVKPFMLNEDWMTPEFPSAQIRYT
ncbi:MAG: NYN domain-containing protein [Candidatus Thermoplasmatota archaeon]|jgi:uncharacterized LabA/DUF88 family protein|nr:NYN domain-containing protein [Candidatus Thermoplasmatota archaeon]MDG6912967.1 NYN domain-containing protein [Nitrososphaerota archaeon]